MKAPLALVTGLTIVCMGVAASSASAATISPTSVDFGRLVIGKTSAPRTLTVTVESADSCHSPPGPTGECYPIITGPFGGFSTGSFPDYPSLGSCHQLAYLTATTPSCTIAVAFQTDEPGHLNGGVLANDYDLGVAEANLTGIGLRSRDDLYCRSPKKGGIYNKNKSRWCVNRQKKKKK